MVVTCLACENTAQEHKNSYIQCAGFQENTIQHIATVSRWIPDAETKSFYMCYCPEADWLL